MAEVLISNAALREMSKLSFLPFKYIALDSSSVAYNPNTQSAPISEITTGGGGRAAANASHDSTTGIVTMSKQFVFTDTIVVKAICPMNHATPGNGTAMYRYIPEEGLLPPSFGAGGSLLVSIECTMNRPS